jgi:hypothetical protein
MTFRHGLGAGLTMAGIERLPTTAAGLAATLRRMWNSIPDSGGTDTRPDKAAVVGPGDGGPPVPARGGRTFTVESAATRRSVTASLRMTPS